MKIHQEVIPARKQRRADKLRATRPDSAVASFSAFIHNLDHISTACAQLKSFFLLRGRRQ